MFIRLHSEFIDIMCDVNPQYRKYITHKKGKKVLYLHVIQSSYVCIEESIFWYDFSENTLQDVGFKVNSYDICVTSKEIDSKQCTVAGYVDDKVIGHMEPVVNDTII